MSTPNPSGVAASLSRNARFLRPALIALVLVDVLALAAFSVRLESVTTTTVTPGAPTAVAAQPVQPSVQVPPPPAAPVTVTAPAAPISSAPVDQPEPAAPVEPAEPTEPTEPTNPVNPTAGAKIARCVVPIKEPTTSGGLQTLIGFAPAFGPFKDEAFAAAAVYQPLLQLLGPILAKYPEIAPKIEPAMAPFLDAFAGLLDQTFALIAPFYTPYRADVLAAEAQLAAALAPFVQKLATSALGGCIVELQAALLEDSGSAPAKAAKR